MIGIALRQNDFQQQLVPALVAAVPDVKHQIVLLFAHFGAVVRMVEHQAFHDMLRRPVDQLRADIAMLQAQRPRAGHFDRTANPPAFAGNGVQRFLAISGIGKNTALVLQSGLARRLFCRLQQQHFQRRDFALVDARFARHIGQLFAMVKGEHVQFRPLLFTRGHAMQVI